MRVRPLEGLGRKQILDRGVTDGIQSQYPRYTCAYVPARGGGMIWPWYQWEILSICLS